MVIVGLHESGFGKLVSRIIALRTSPTIRLAATFAVIVCGCIDAAIFEPVAVTC